MGSLTTVAKLRPAFMARCCSCFLLLLPALLILCRVITALEMFQANLPPTLAKSQVSCLHPCLLLARFHLLPQVSSVRKHLKNQLLALLRHPTAAEHFFTNMTTLLTDLGAGREEVMRAMPQFEEMKCTAKRKEREAASARKEAEGSSAAKRPKVMLLLFLLKLLQVDPADDEASDEDDSPEGAIVP